MEAAPALIGRVEAAASTAQEVGVAGTDAMAAGSDFAGSISATNGRIEALPVVDGSTLLNPASVSGSPPKLSTYVHGGGGEYVTIGEHSTGDAAFLEIDPNARMVSPLQIAIVGFSQKSNAIYYFSAEVFESVSVSTASRPDGVVLDGLGPVTDSASATVPEGPAFGWFVVSWTSSMTAGGRGPVLSQGSSAQSEEALRSDGGSDEPVPPGSITAGEIPLDILLSDPEASTQDVTIGLQQIAELIPVEDSSLALVATLWTVPSDTQAEPAEESDPSGAREESVPSSASPPPWAVFVIGLDEAFERSRDACGKMLSDGAGKVEGEEAGDAVRERLEWRCPIIPTAEGRRQLDRAEWSSSGVGPAAIDRATPSGEADPCRPLPSRLSRGEERVARACPEDGSPHHAGDGRPLTEGALPLAWAASGSALIAGWFWARRRLRQGWGLGRSGRKNHRRGGRDHFEEGP
jgi:hypothetical protein